MLRRRGADRKPKVLKRPDVTLTGHLRVTDGEAFMKLLASGIGRHKSFGFGMLKIRPTR
jgi:CRISPR system Cascade subunit CasE